MPNRIIKESINESSGLAACSEFAIDLFKRLITYADDYGRFNADTEIMRARLYPREYMSIDESDIIDGLIELVGVGKIQFYEPEVFNQQGKRGVYGAFPNWKEHQRVRNTKAKCPEPGDTRVNDWYLRRFIPVDMKVKIIERDKFKCSICGKYLTSCDDAKRFVKLGGGLYHIDHIVPVLQGGRATLENLRLTCPTCNQSRKKTFSFNEFIDEWETSAASCGELRQTLANSGFTRAGAESESNPIQSESNPNTNTNPNADEPPLEALSYYMNAINPMPPSTVVSEMQDYVDELSDKVVLHAIQIAVGERKVGWNYIRAILRNYKAEGVKTMEDVLRREEEHQKKRNPVTKDPYATYYDDNPFEGWDE